MGLIGGRKLHKALSYQLHPFTASFPVHSVDAQFQRPKSYELNSDGLFWYTLVTILDVCFSLSVERPP